MAAMLIDTNSQLAAFCESLRGEPAIFLDTEFVGEGYYHKRLGTIQMGSASEAAIIDALAVDDMAPLGRLLADPDVVKVFHAATQDLQILVRLFGAPVAPLFDTQVAAQLTTGDEQIGFDRLVTRITGQSPASGHSFTDWLRRPLTPGQIEYALDDVRLLVPVYQWQCAKLAELELELARLRQLYTDKHPRVLTVQASIAETKLRLGNEVSRIVNSESPAANPIHVGLLQARIQAEAELAAASAQREALQKVMADGEAELAKLPTKEQGMARVMRDAIVAQEIYSMLAKRFEEARISEVMQPTDAQVVNPAVEPDRPIRPRKALNVAIAALLGLFTGVGAAFALEFMNRTIRTADDVKEYLDLPVLGAIPHFDSEMVPRDSDFTRALNRLRGLLGDRKGK